MERNWVYDEVIQRGLNHARERELDLGVSVVSVLLSDIESEGSVIPNDYVVKSIKNAVRRGLAWPKGMPLPMLVCEGTECFAIDGNHRIKAARIARLTEIPAIVASRSTWEELLPVIEQEDVIPYDDFIAILAEAGAAAVRKNLATEAKATDKYGPAR